MVLFISHYPDEDSIKDGMAQRIFNIDSFFRTESRTYLDISLRRFPKIQTKTNGNLTVIECNLFLHFFYICKVFKSADKIYVHSVLNVLNSLICFLFYKKDLFLDLHGVVPEEHKMDGKQLHYFLYKFSEKIIFYKVKTAICVSENMKSFYQKSYPKSKANYVIYPILPNTLSDVSYSEDVLDSTGKVNFVYSGNTQKWQNIDLMVDIISKNLKDNFVYYILTRNVDEMKMLFEKKIDLTANPQIKFLSVAPSQLADYYRKCHYGFILRDDVLVNQVACPTKLVEYLHHGIIPIVLSPNIGDFETFHYDYILSTQSFEDLVPNKSSSNVAIVQKLLDRNKGVNIKDLVLLS